MEITIETPALIFSAISLLMIAYTTRYVSLSQVIRDLSTEYKEQPTNAIKRQINSLMKRVKYIRNMQVLALTAFAINILTMIFIMIGIHHYVDLLFFFALSLVIMSLVICIIEVSLSAQALEVLLQDIK